MDELLVLLILTIFMSPAIAVGYGVGVVRTKRKTKSDPSVAVEAIRLDAVVEDIKHHAYEHMTLGDGGLAPIVVDIIRESEKKRDKNLILSAQQSTPGQPKTPFIQLTSSPLPPTHQSHQYPPTQHPAPQPPHQQAQYPYPQPPQSAPVAPPPVAPSVLPPTHQQPGQAQHYPFQ